MKTLVIIKPDAWARGLFDKIIVRLDGLPDSKIVYLKTYSHLPRHKLKHHYREHEGKPFFDHLIAAMCHRPAAVLVVEGPNIVRRVRALIGATDPQKAEPGTIRGDFRCAESAGPYNMIHASDSWQAAIDEMIIWDVIKPEGLGELQVDADPDLALQPQKGWLREGHNDPEDDREGSESSI